MAYQFFTLPATPTLTATSAIWNITTDNEINSELVEAQAFLRLVQIQFYVSATLLRVETASSATGTSSRSGPDFLAAVENAIKYRFVVDGTNYDFDIVPSGYGLDSREPYLYLSTNSDDSPVLQSLLAAIVRTSAEIRFSVGDEFGDDGPDPGTPGTLFYVGDIGISQVFVGRTKIVGMRVGDASLFG